MLVFRLFKADETEAGALTYTTTGNTWNVPASTSYVSITSGEMWAMKVEITGAAGAHGGVSTDISMAIIVR